MRISPDDPRQGTTSGYRRCHCAACQAATATYQREQRAKRQGMLLDRSMLALNKRAILGQLDHGTKPSGAQGSPDGIDPTVESDNIEVIAAQKLRDILIAWGPCFHPVQPCDCWPDVRGAILNAARAIDPNLGRW